VNELVGDDLTAPCVDGVERRYLSLDAAASTGALPAVAARVQEFLPWYSSIHRGAGWKSQLATGAYEDARSAFAAHAGREGTDDIAIICRNTTEAINHLAYRLALRPDDVVVTTVVEHHANLLPWGRHAQRRYVECDTTGTFEVDAVTSALDRDPRPRLLAITGASNVTGWVPPLDEIIIAAHDRGVPVLVDAAQVAPHRPLPPDADYLAWSGHKMYAPFGAGVLVGPRAVLEDMEIASVTSFLWVVVIFTVLQSLFAPFLAKVTARNASALLGAVGLLSTFLALLIAATVSDGLTISGASTWLYASLIVWLVTMLATLLIPLILVKMGVQAARDRRD